MTNKFNFSGPTISPNTYAGQFAGKYIAAALLSGDTLAKDLITVHPNVAYKEVIRNWQNSLSIVDATCDFTDSSSVTLGEYVLTTKEKQVNMQLCKNQFRTTWEAAQADWLQSGAHQILQGPVCRRKLPLKTGRPELQNTLSSGALLLVGLTPRP